MNLQIQKVLQQVIQAFQDGKIDKADLILNEILQKDINNADTIFELGIIYARANKFSEASVIFSCLQLYKNNDIRIHYNLGLIHSLHGEHHLALAAYDLAIKIKPDDAEVLINIGSTYIDIKNYVLALEVLEKAIQISPNIPEAWSNKGIVLNNLNLYQESIDAYEEAIKLDSNHYKAWSNKSVPLNKLKKFSESLNSCDKALDLKPDYAEGWANKGVTLYELKRYNEALAHYDKALDLKPDYAEGWSNKGNVLNELKRYDEALAHYDKALDLKPDYAEGWANKGVTLYELKRYNEALAHYDKALDLKPDINWLYGSLIQAKIKICNWSDLSKFLKVISKKVKENLETIYPFSLLALCNEPLLHKKSSEIYAQSLYPYNPVLGPISKRSQDQKIRIGYFSADFKNHPVGLLIAELFELHDRNQFAIYGFSLVTAADEMRQRLQRAFDYFIEAQEMSDIEIARLSRSLNIDIAIDLTGFTQNARTGVFAHRAAPIQVNYLGYPGTMGADYIDYIIADKTLIPPESKSCYSEKVIYLPNSYQVNDRKRLISDRQFTREELGLPESAFVFCCFNNNFKILPATFEGWMRILKAAEGSVLWLLEDNSWAEKSLKKEAEKQGIAADRLVFARRLPLPDHLARHRKADLFLDTFPYNAHTTASDALWAGLPILTLMGNSFASRVAASLLNAIGLTELIVNTQEKYEAMAIELALNPKKLSNIKSKLVNNRLTTSLFDTPVFAKNLEIAYIKTYERYQADLEADHITIN